MQGDKAAILRSLDEGRISLDEARKAIEEILQAERASRCSVSESAAQPTSSPHSGSIAIIGMAGRFPGARNVETLWGNLASGISAVTQAPTDRGWDVLDYFDPNPQTPGKTYVSKGCFLDGIDEFDPMFFGIAPRDAMLMDPAERLFMQEAWRAVEDAGYGPERVSGQPWGVFAAVKGDYETYIRRDDPTYFLGTESFAAARLSYLLHLLGPAVTVDTACSSTLVAISQACDNLLLGNCTVAVAGGASVYSTPTTLITASQSLLFSPEARCCSFDDRANGTVLGEAAGALVLKPLADAERDGDAIYGVIRGWGVNQDGRTNGITAPSATSQTELQTSIYKRRGINPEAITLVEAHGTGTKLGDPIEFSALDASFRAFTKRSRYCALGSLKPNIGHTFFAAGIASAIKVLLCLKHRQIPPSINFVSVNQRIALTNSPFYISTELRDWNIENGQKRLAAINSFGLSGTNAHLVVEEYEGTPSPNQVWPSGRNLPAATLFPLSAQSGHQLSEYVQALVKYLDAMEDSPSASRDQARSLAGLAQIAFTLQVGRRAMDERLAVVAASISELKAQLAAFSTSSHLSGVHRQRVSRDAAAHATVSRGAEIDARDPERIAQAWVQGTDINWNLLWGGEPPRAVHLPTYPFAKERCWFPRGRFDVAYFLGNSAPKPDEPVQVEVASIEQSSGKQWLCFAERWKETQASAPPANLRIEGSGVGKHVMVVSADEKDAVDLDEQLRQIAEKASIHIRPPLVEWLNIKGDGPAHSSETPRDAVSTFFQDKGAPDIVFILLPGETTPEREFRHLDLVLRCCRELMTYWWERPVDIYLCCASGVTPSTPRDEAFSGLLHSAMLESPNHQYRWIHHDAKGELRARDLARESWHRETGRGHVLHVRYRNGTRSMSRREEITRVAIAGGACALRPDGIYLIVGGLGEVGRRLCLEMAAKYQCTLVIASRRNLDEETERILADLRATGAQVLFFSVDAADAGAMGQAYEKIKRQVARIDGVIHLARSVNDSPIVGKSVETFERTITAKVLGVEVVDLLTKDEPLEFFLMFSSMAAFGLAGSADYAYACAFQNAFAGYRNHLRDTGIRRGRSLALDWGQWEADQYVDKTRRAKWRQAGFDLIDAPSALRVIEACLNSQEAVLGWVAVTDKERARSAPVLASAERPQVFAHQGQTSSIEGPVVLRSAPASGQSELGRTRLRAALEKLSLEELQALYSSAVSPRPTKENVDDGKIA